MADKKIFAYTAVTHRNKFIVGRADLCEKGYTPQIDHGVFDSYNEASDKADKLNEELGLSAENAMRIVGTTMRFENPCEKIVKRIAEFLPPKSGDKMNGDGLIDWLCEEGIEDIKEALS